MGAGLGTASPSVRARPRPPSREGGRAWLVAASGLLTLVVVDTVRVWLPALGVSLAGTVDGSAAVAAVSFATAALAAGTLPWLRRSGPVAWWRAGVIGVAVARTAVQLAEAPAVLAVASTATMLAGFVALAALAAGSPSGHLARLGALAGLVVAAGSHLALGTWSLAWREGLAATGAVVLYCAVLVVAAERARHLPLWWPTPTVDGGQLAPVWTRGPAWPWLGFGPAAALVLLVVAAPGRAAGHSAVWSAGGAWVVLGGGLGLLVAVYARRIGAAVSGGGGALLLVLGTVAVVGPTGAWPAIGQAAVLAGLGGVLGAAGLAPGDSGPRRRAGALLASVGLAWAMTVGYVTGARGSATVDRAWLLAGGVAMATLGLWAAHRARGFRQPAGPDWRLGMGVVAATAVAALASGPAAEPAAAPPALTVGDELRVAVQDLSGGFGPDGRFAPEEIAAGLRSSGADVVVLHGVDRGWLPAGGHDLLELVADAAGFPHAAFAPARDTVWGDAVLSRVPLREVRQERLPRAGSAHRRALISVVVERGPNGPMALVGAQLADVDEPTATRTGQARAVAAEVSRQRSRGLPVALLADLRSAPEAPELAPLAFLVDAAGRAGATTPAPDPLERTTQVLTTPDLVGTDATTLPTAGVRHRPLVVTLRPAG